MSHIESNCGEFATIKPIGFERSRNEAGSNYFVLSPQRWIEATQAVGITSKSGRYGGTNWTSQIVMSSMNGGCAALIHPTATLFFVGWISAAHPPSATALIPNVPPSLVGRISAAHPPIGSPHE